MFKSYLKIRKPVCSCWIRICVRNNLSCSLQLLPKVVFSLQLKCQGLHLELRIAFLKIHFFIVNIKLLFEAEIRIFIYYVPKYILLCNRKLI